MIYSDPSKHSIRKQISLFQKGLKIVVYVLLVGALTLINNMQVLAEPFAIPLISKSHLFHKIMTVETVKSKDLDMVCIKKKSSYATR